VPQGFNYQAIARDGSGTILANLALPVKIDIQTSLTGGTLIYEELFASITSNSFGLISLVVGTGTQTGGSAASFSAIDWKAQTLYLKTIIQYPGTTWTTMGTSQIWAVPYSLVSKEVTGPLTKLGITGTTTDMEEALFEVKNQAGNTVFAVYNEGIRAYVGDGSSKGTKGGFSVGGYDATKGSTYDLFTLNTDSARLYFDTKPNLKGKKGGFSVGGYDMTKSAVQEFLDISKDSVRVYVDSNPLNKGVRGGFAVGGYDMTKGGSPISNYLNIETNSTGIINPAENRILWYPLKNAFLTGRVLITDPANVGVNSFASGYESQAIGQYSQALGYKCVAQGSSSVAIGYQSVSATDYSTSLGDNNNSNGQSSITVGSNNTTTGNNSLAIGLSNKAVGPYSVAIGYASETGIESYSCAIGYLNKATGAASVALGGWSTASGWLSFAMGYGALAKGLDAIAMGYETQATGSEAVALGFETTASAGQSFAVGAGTQALQYASAAFGENTIANSTYTTVIGKANEGLSNSLFEIGYGTYDGSSGTRSNVLTVLNNGLVGIGTSSPSAKMELAVSGNSGYAGIGLNRVAEGGKLITMNQGTIGKLNFTVPGVVDLVTFDFVNNRAGINNTSPAYPFQVGTPGSNGNGAYVTTGGVWTNGSSRLFKEKFNVLDASEILAKITKLDIESWYFKNSEEFHIGPVAEDFYALFGTGDRNSKEVNKYLSSSDVAGVGLLAIQELVKQNGEQKAQIEKQQDEINSLKSEIEHIKTLVGRHKNK
jgi:hypothetical protein